MKPKVLLAILTAVVASLLAIWLFRPVPDLISNESSVPTTETGSEGVSNKPEAIFHEPDSQESASDLTGTPSNYDRQRILEEFARQRGVPLNVLTQQAIVEWSNMWQSVRQTVNRPIEFYGKVVDENGMPLEGVEVGFSCLGYPEDYFTTNVLSAKDGVFLLKNVTGAALDVQVSKEGYEEMQGSNQVRFMYYSTQSFRPDQNNPVVFYLRKKVE